MLSVEELSDMGILKYGLIGFLIFIPFLIVGQISIDYYKAEQKVVRYLEEQIEEASYDAAFAIKTYTKGSFYSDNVYQIDVDFKEVIECFNQSLTFRRLPIQLEDFSLLMMVAYDGIIAYNPELQRFLPKVHYINKENGRANYYNLSSTYLSVDIATGVIYEEILLDESIRNDLIIEAIESVLVQNEYLSGRDLHIEYLIPEVGSSLFNEGIVDMAFIPIFESEAIISGKTLALFNISSAGVMKIQQESIVNY